MAPKSPGSRELTSSDKNASSSKRSIKSPATRSSKQSKGTTSNPSDEETVVPKNRIYGSGGINFVRNFTHYNKIHPYYYVAHDIKTDFILHRMHRKWLLQMPHIVTVIITDIKYSESWQNPRQIMNLKNGLIKAADTSNMWIFTNGLDSGITKIIGEAVNIKLKEQSFARDLRKAFPTTSDSLNFIGVVRDDRLKTRHALKNDYVINDVDESKWPTVKLGDVGSQLKDNRYQLNPDHSHFLIVHDHSREKTGYDKFLISLLRFLSTTEVRHRKPADLKLSLNRNKKSQSFSVLPGEVPVVGILIGGGLESSKLVFEFIKNTFPVVILQGTSGLADIMSFAYNEIHDRLDDETEWGKLDDDFVESFLKPEITAKINRLLPESAKTSEGNELLTRIIDILKFAWSEPNSYITVVNTDSTDYPLDNISIFLLRALLKSRTRFRSATSHHKKHEEDTVFRELMLAMDWNCIEVAKNDVVPQDPLFLARLPRETFIRTLFFPGRESFIDMYLQHGFRTHSFLSPLRLRKLFLLSYEEEFFRSVCWEGILGHSPLNKLGKNFIEDDLNFLIQICTGLTNFINPDHLFYNLLTMYIQNAASAERKSITLLAIWAGFSNRILLAKTFWKHCDTPIQLGIIMSKILQHMAPYITDTNIQEDVQREADNFGKMAVGVFDECYKLYPTRVLDLLSEKSPDWNQMSAVSLAANADLKLFISHPACQRWLTDEFCGHIRVREASWGILTIPRSIKLLCSAYFVWPMYFWIQFNIDDKIGLETRSKSFDDVEDEEKQIAAQLMKNKSPKNFTIKNRRSNWFSQFRAREYFIFQRVPIWTMIYWVWTAPITKFYQHQIFFCFYLGLLCWVILQPPCRASPYDRVIVLWSLVYAIELYRRTMSALITSDNYERKQLSPLRCFFFTIVLIVYANNVFHWKIPYIILSPYHVKVLLAFAIVYFFYRLLAIFLKISPTLGPSIYRIQLMIAQDFLNFSKILILVILAGGAILQALIFPDGIFGLLAFRKAFDRAWFALFYTPLDDLKADHKCPLHDNSSASSCLGSIYRDPDGLQCPYINVWPYFFLSFYLVLVKLILLTVLYAFFSTSGNRIETESDKIWKFQRYVLVQDFTHRLPFPTPLCVIAYPFIIVNRVCALIKNIWYVMRSVVEWFNNKCTGLKKARTVSQKMTILRSFFNWRPESTDWDRGKYVSKLTDEDYSYWKFLARQYCEKVTLNEFEVKKRIVEDLQYNFENLESLKHSMRKLEVRMNEIENAVCGRLGHPRRKVLTTFKSDPERPVRRVRSWHRSYLEYRSRHHSK